MVPLSAFAIFILTVGSLALGFFVLQSSKAKEGSSLEDPNQSWQTAQEDRTATTQRTSDLPVTREFSPTPPPKTSTPSVALSPTPLPAPTTTVANQNDENEFKYPSAQIVSETRGQITLKSTDNPKNVSNWYKEKIRSQNMPVTSFIETSTNGNILNSLVGQRNGRKIRVEISRKEGETTVSISVSFVDSGDGG